MDLMILDADLQTLATVDSFESIIWTDRYSEYGDFEIYSPIAISALSYIALGRYVWRRDASSVMMIEQVKIESDAENGSHLTISGRSLEALLTRRIIWKQTRITGNFQNGVKKLIDDAMISPEDEERKVANFIFKESTDERITKLTIDAQFTGDNLYDAIKKLCDIYDLGFKITLSDTNNFVFELVIGEDRSYDQEKNPWVIFSPKFDNLINSNYIQSNENECNVALVAGEGEGESRKTVTVITSETSPKGLDRKELYVDARDLSSISADGETSIPDDQYASDLVTRGLEYLSENIYVESFEASVDPNGSFQYGRDYFVGDIVQIQNEYGMEAKVRVTELVRSESPSGIENYPTFVFVNEEITEEETDGQ